MRRDHNVTVANELRRGHNVRVTNELDATIVLPLSKRPSRCRVHNVKMISRMIRTFDALTGHDGRLYSTI